VVGMNEQAKQIIDEFVQRARALYGDRLKHVVVYGSCARDEATAESDIDLAVVLAGEVVPGEEVDRVIDLITDLNLEYGVLLSVYPVSEEDYVNRNGLLPINIRREGIPAGMKPRR
jgi:predicted nucleotidyltransferase